MASLNFSPHIHGPFGYVGPIWGVCCTRLKSYDFRSIYAGILDQWLKADPPKILGEGVRAANVVRKA